MTDRIWLRSRPGEIEIVVVRGGSLADYGLWRPGAPDGLGDLHRGQVSALVSSLGGSFVRLEGEPDGFLPDGRAAPPASVGMLVGVRIVRSSHGEKGPKLTLATGADEAEAAIGERRLVRRGSSPLDDLTAAHPDLPVETADRALAAELRLVRLNGSDGGCGPNVEDEIAALREPSIDLPGGARASISPTPALVAIDVDTAGASDTRATKQIAQFAANRALLPRLLHEVRLRNLSGAILVDLAGLAARKRGRLAGDFANALSADPLGPRFLGFTALGLAEIVRVRRRPALHELLQSPHGRALGAAADLAARQADEPHRAYGLRASPDLARSIDADPMIGRDLARGNGRPFILRPDPSLKAGHWSVEELTV